MNRDTSTIAYENRIRPGWDAEISNWHRQWGYNCPATDLDFVLIEYDHCKAVGLFEHKRYSQWWNENHQAWDKCITDLYALEDLATERNRPIPCGLIIYHPTEKWLIVFPINDKGRQYFNDGQVMSMKEYASMLYRIRNRNPEEIALIKNLPDYKPNLSVKLHNFRAYFGRTSRTPAAPQSGLATKASQ